MRSRHLLAVALAFAASRAYAQPGSRSDAIRFLVPAAFVKLPPIVRRDLEDRRCRVPQPWDEKAPANVLHGAFTRARADEWAVLCSVRDTSQILIYPSKSARAVDSIASLADRLRMQGVGNGRDGYSRLLRIVPAAQIRRWRVDVDGRVIPLPIDHDGIEDIFIDKAADGYYFAAGRWYRQITAD